MCVDSVPEIHPHRWRHCSPVAAPSEGVFNVSLGLILEESGAILVVPFLHPVPVDPERSRVNELTNDLDTVRVLFDDSHLDGLRVEVEDVEATHRNHSQGSRLQHRHGDSYSNGELAQQR